MDIRISIFVAFFCSSVFVKAQTSPSSASPNFIPPQGKVTPPSQVVIANEPTVRVVSNVMPAVVNITAEATVPQYDMVDPFFRRYRVRNEKSIGSGLLISADGYIVTNAHVVALAQKTVTVTSSTLSKYTAKIISTDEDQDLALLKIDDNQIFPYYDLSHQANLSPSLLGETVIALGSPAGYQNSVSQGILSAKGRAFQVEGHTFKNLIQTDAAINPGNSGGPLVDLNGGLVGINSAKLSGEAIESIGFAIPAEVVVPWIDDALAVARGQKTAPVTINLNALQERFGIKVKNFTPELADSMNLDLTGGLVITEVEEGSPASEAGLHVGMVIVAIGNSAITDDKSLPSPLSRIKPGGRANLHVVFRQQEGPFVIIRGGTAALVAR